MAITATISTRSSKQAPKLQTDDNPVMVFEQRARQILTSNLGKEEKAARLTDLSNAISKYVARLNVHLDSTNLDGWSAMTANRFRIYLCQLGDDVRKLASSA